MTHTGRFRVDTEGHNDVIDVTEEVRQIVRLSGIRSGIAVVFVVGSTAAVTTTEAEPGLMNHDLRAFFENIAPEGAYYRHEETWNDDNGHSHVRAAMLGPSVTLPVIGGDIPLGNWQQVVLLDFDTRNRKREMIVQIVGDMEEGR